VAPDSLITAHPVDVPRLERICRELLEAIGEDPDREGLRDTPRRFAAAWAEFVDYDPGRTGTVFESVSADQMVVISHIPVWSKCEHHLEPFSAEVSIGYVTEAQVLGLSKFARIVQYHAHRLQLQERLCQDVADHVMELAGTENVAVLATGLHLCMAARGIRSAGQMTTSVMRGVFRTKPEARAEFMALVNQGRSVKA
jgi:GTP cyclohydrolase I